MQQKHALVVGGTKGLGLDLAKLLQKVYQVTIVGRDPANIEFQSFNFHYLDLAFKSFRPLGESIDFILEDNPIVDLLVYAAGFPQFGTIDQLSDERIADMDSVGLKAPMTLVAHLMKRQKKLPGFIAITSTSERIPRLKEPCYTAVKAGLAKFAESISLDPRVGRTLVAAPAGMKSGFWPSDKDTTGYLETAWVAEQIDNLYHLPLEFWTQHHYISDHYRYMHAEILRDPSRIGELEIRLT